MFHLTFTIFLQLPESPESQSSRLPGITEHVLASHDFDPSHPFSALTRPPDPQQTPTDPDQTPTDPDQQSTFHAQISKAELYSHSYDPRFPQNFYPSTFLADREKKGDSDSGGSPVATFQSFRGKGNNVPTSPRERVVVSPRQGAVSPSLRQGTISLREGAITLTEEVVRAASPRPCDDVRDTSKITFQTFRPANKSPQKDVPLTHQQTEYQNPQKLARNLAEEAIAATHAGLSHQICTFPARSSEAKKNSTSPEDSTRNFDVIQQKIAKSLAEEAIAATHAGLSHQISTFHKRNNETKKLKNTALDTDVPDDGVQQKLAKSLAEEAIAAAFNKNKATEDIISGDPEKSPLLTHQRPPLATQGAVSLAPRIDISRASSSSREHDSKDSGTEAELEENIDDYTIAGPKSESKSKGTSKIIYIYNNNKNNKW